METTSPAVSLERETAYPLLLCRLSIRNHNLIFAPYSIPKYLLWGFAIILLTTETDNGGL